jgi:ATP-dependent helicase/nuclease subunit A
VTASVTLNDEQLRAVETRGADLCVEAGAGTGKTRVLTERIVARVGEGADLARILAITFTEKAAHEMKERLARALLDRGVATAREDVEAAPISTVHAFCARLLREHAVEAGVDPAFAVVEERQADELRREALAALVAELAAEDRDALDRLAELRGGDPEATLLDVYERARESVHAVGEFVRRLPPGPGPADVLSAVRTDVDRAVDLRGGANPTWQRKIDAVAAAAARLPAGNDDPAAAAQAVASVLGAFDLRGKAGPEKEAFETLKATCNEALAVLADACQAPLRDCLARVLERLELLHERAKGDGAALDFTDLERRAVALLRSRDDVRDALRERFVEVLVDEFQDTSPVQAELFELVRPQRSLFVVGDPKQSIYGFRGADVDVFLRRRDDVEAAGDDGALVRLDQSFRARDGVTRFVNRVFANGVSQDDEAAGVRGVAYEPLRAGREFPDNGQPCIEVFAFAADDAHAGRDGEASWLAERIHAMVLGDEPAMVTRRRDGEDVLEPAEFGDVAILLRATTHVKLLERALTAREIPYLVVKGRGFYEAREVVDLGNLLACVVDPTEDVRLAAVLRSPCCGVGDDTLFALGSARVEDETLASVLARVAAGTALDNLPAEEVLRVRAFAGVLARLRAARAREPLAVLVDLALETTGLDVVVLARPNGRQRAANLRKVREMALDADRRGDVSLAQFAAGLRELRRREVRETEAPIAGGTRGAVSILTVHAAKGLEFPIVIVPDLGRQETQRGGDVVSHVRDGVGLKGSFPPGHPLSDVTPRSHAVVQLRNRAREAAESMRLLYVAMTRAEERLLLTAVTGTGRGGARPWWDRVEAVLPPPDADADFAPEDGGASAQVVWVAAADGGPDVAVLLHPPLPPARSTQGAVRTLLHGVAKTLAAGRVPSGSPKEAAVASAEALLADARRTLPPALGTLYATTVSALVAFGRCPEEFRRRHLLGIPETLDLTLSLDGEAGEVAGPAGAERPGDDDEWGVPLSVRAKGRAVHLALERLAPSFGGNVAAVVREALATETGGGEPSPDDVAELSAWVVGFRDGEIGQRLRQVPRAGVRREQAVLLQCGGRTVVRGQIDLLFHDGASWTLVDYKAGALDAVEDAYALQMRLYALALRGVAGEVPGRLVLWSLPGARAVEISATDAKLSELRDGLLDDFVRRTREGDFAPPPERPCFSCAYRSSCGLSLA